MNKILLIVQFVSTLFAKEIIAVLDLEQIGLTKEEAQILTQGLTTKLISLDKYQVVERTNIDKILKEQQFQHSGCTNSECAVEIGQLLNTDYIVIGSVNKFGSTWALYARLIDVGLGKSLISAEFSMEGKIDLLLTSGITSIARQICGLNSSSKTSQNYDNKLAAKYKMPGSSNFPEWKSMGISKNEWLKFKKSNLNQMEWIEYNSQLKSPFRNLLKSILLPGLGFRNIGQIKKSRYYFIFDGIILPSIIFQVNGADSQTRQRYGKLIGLYGVVGLLSAYDSYKSTRKYNDEISKRYNVPIQN